MISYSGNAIQSTVPHLEVGFLVYQLLSNQKYIDRGKNFEKVCVKEEARAITKCSFGRKIR